MVGFPLRCATNLSHDLLLTFLFLSFSLSSLSFFPSPAHSFLLQTPGHFTENIPCPDQFWPISITNSDYQIVMRYWAKWLMESAREVISPEQNAMFAGRSIDNAVELIHDWFMEVVAEGKDMTILQTDFCKAYDYVNREALMELLIGLNAPPQALEVVSKVLQESDIWLPTIELNDKTQKEAIKSQTSVQQGCPISPLLFIILFDVLLVSLNNGGDLEKLAGFMDDLALLLHRVQSINS